MAAPWSETGKSFRKQLRVAGKFFRQQNVHRNNRLIRRGVPWTPSAGNSTTRCMPSRYSGRRPQVGATPGRQAAALRRRWFAIFLPG